ncbi:L-lactate dehydrogenase [bacterium]|nr:L-lactate dehydrogenase [bacterium]
MFKFKFIISLLLFCSFLLQADIRDNVEIKKDAIIRDYKFGTRRKHTKITIIGTGKVGATIAYTLMLRNIAGEIILIDKNIERCKGEELDLSDVISFSKTSKIKIGTIEDARDSDIVVICAGAKQKPGEKRGKFVAINKKIMSTIIEDLKPINQNVKIIVVTNPVDIMTYFVQQYSGLPKKQVFGTGTFLDTQRTRGFLAKTLGIAEKSVQVYTLGEHGDSQFIVWSSASVAGKPITEFYEIDNNSLDQFLQLSKNKAYEIIKYKGATFFGIAACVSEICESILFDKKYVVPLSTYIKEFNVCMSMPVVIGENGIENIIHIPLNNEEQKLLKISADKIKKIIDKS